MYIIKGYSITQQQRNKLKLTRENAILINNLLSNATKPIFYYLKTILFYRKIKDKTLLFASCKLIYYKCQYDKTDEISIATTYQ